jgi:YVTN family beta-propeller protein
MRRFLPLWGLFGALALGGIAVDAFAAATRSTTIALTSDDRRRVVVNRENHSVSIIRVRDLSGLDTSVKLAEVAVGKDPRCVAIRPDNREAFATNAASGTVSVIALAGPHRYSVVAEIPVAPELRGCALLPTTGLGLFVASYTDGNVYLIDVAQRTVAASMPVGGNPTALAITDDGDDTNETLFATQFLAEPVPGGPGEGFDTGKRGIVHAISLHDFSVIHIPLCPLANVGFTADRTAFCPQTNPNLHRPDLPIFCPDVNAPPGTPVITQDPQGCFPPANPRASLGRLFANDLIDIDATPDGQVFLSVSRGGNYIIRATLDAAHKLTIGAPNNVIRWQME